MRSKNKLKKPPVRPRDLLHVPALNDREGSCPNWKGETTSLGTARCDIVRHPKLCVFRCRKSVSKNLFLLVLAFTKVGRRSDGRGPFNYLTLIGQDPVYQFPFFSPRANGLANCSQLTLRSETVAVPLPALRQKLLFFFFFFFVSLSTLHATPKALVLWFTIPSLLVI